MDELKEKETNVELIMGARKELADLRMKKAKMKASLWEEATGTVDQKKDYIRGETAEIDREIAYKEANIEYLYNKIDIIGDKLVFGDE